MALRRAVFLSIAQLSIDHQTLASAADLLVPPREPVELAMVFAATDDTVYVSRDLGKSWGPASQGLPKRPHCGDLQFVAPTGGERTLYLSTLGRSIWRATL